MCPGASSRPDSRVGSVRLATADREGHRRRVRDHVLYKCGAWSQGPSMLQALRILETYRI